MTGQPEHAHAGGGEHGSDERLSDEGVGMGMSEEGSTFEPEETPEAVDEPDEHGAGGAEGSATDTVVEPRELVPDDDRVDEAEAPREVLPDAERGVDDQVELESERLLPDDERPVPGGPADD